ncbi:Transcription initiation factor TFIID subunit 2 [Hypoxylon texense]
MKYIYQKPLPTQTVRLIEQLELHSILLVEWEYALLIRLGYPQVPNSDLIFLVPDEQLDTVEKLAADIGYHGADHEMLPPVYPSEECNRSLRYRIQRPGKTCSRVVLLPLSWTGVSPDEVVRVSAAENDLPCSVSTLPVSVACTAFVRIASREERGSKVRNGAIASLCHVIAYHFFDTSYEGDYYEIPPDDQPLSEKEVLEMANAVDNLKGWEMREGEEWIRSGIIKAMTGATSYHALPCKSD